MYQVKYKDVQEAELAHSQWCNLAFKAKRNQNKSSNVLIKWVKDNYNLIILATPEQQLSLLNEFFELLFSRINQGNIQLLRHESKLSFTIKKAKKKKTNKYFVNNVYFKLSSRTTNKQLLTAASFGVKKLLCDFFQFCHEIFNYDLFIQKRITLWDEYNLVESIENTVCPCCNRNFTHTVHINNKGIGRPELDHFIAKSEFPMFALSFYNLIPVCHSCNHAKRDTLVIKKDSNNRFAFDHIHPNMDRLPRFKTKVFSTSLPSDISNYLLDSKLTLKGKMALTKSIKNNEMIINSFSIYNLAVTSADGKSIDGYYANHYKEIETALDKLCSYPAKALEGIGRLLCNDENEQVKVKTKLVSKQLKQSFVNSLIPEDCAEQPLAKFKNDILKDTVNNWANKN
jgi:hypothetical protein